MTDKFNESIDNQYADIIQKFEKITTVTDFCEKENLLRNIINEYMEIKYHDYFNADLGGKIDEILLREQKRLNELKFESEGGQ